MTLDVLVSVGTDVHRFDRLMGWLEAWHIARPDHPAMLVQHGSSRAPSLPGATPFLTHDELNAAMAAARVVVTHGGPASITEARRHGHVPVVVARDPAYDEHVDNHQMLFTTRMAALGLIRLCATEEDLTTALTDGLAADGPRSNATDSTSRAAAVAAVGRIVDDLVAARRPRIPRSRDASDSRGSVSRWRR